jgi:hypothetical protein
MDCQLADVSSSGAPPDNRGIVGVGGPRKRDMSDRLAVPQSYPGGQFSWRGKPFLRGRNAFKGVAVLGMDPNENLCKLRYVSVLARTSGRCPGGGI